MATMTVTRLVPRPAALVLLGLLVASVGPPVAAAADPDVVVVAGPGAAPAGSACADDRAVLVHLDDGVLRCEDGVPVPRPRPWNAGGCGEPVWVPSVTATDEPAVFIVVPGACLVARQGAGRVVIEAGR